MNEKTISLIQIRSDTEESILGPGSYNVSITGNLLNFVVHTQLHAHLHPVDLASG